MNDFPIQDITLYHEDNKKWFKYNLEASFRNTNVLMHSRTGFTSKENAVIRIFNSKYDFIKIGDVIVNKKIDDIIEENPLTRLREKYGKDNVVKIENISNLVFDDEDLEELNHIRIGAI